MLVDRELIRIESNAFFERGQKNENYWTKKSHDITLYKKKNSMNFNQHHPF